MLGVLGGGLGVLGWEGGQKGRSFSRNVAFFFTECFGGVGGVLAGLGRVLLGRRLGVFGGLLGHLGGSTGAGGWAWAEAVGWGCGWGLGLCGLVRLSTKA